MTIAAKPTLYKGIRFRSRLEARWAVFFDALDLSWTYEPMVPGVHGYVPDFQVESDAFVEVKPDSWHEAPDYEKLYDFVDGTDRVLFVTIGEPGRWEQGRRVDGAFGIIVRDGGREPAVWTECTQCGFVAVARPHQRICDCVAPISRLDFAFNAVRDHSYEDA